jgi:LAO/AO transport system kinase
VEQHVSGVLSGDRSLLARTITLIESNASEHFEKARQVLKALLPHSGKSLRIGVTGIPGSGKSTLIETLGCFLIEKGFNVAVLSVDPTSTVTKGSILGDKTRMEKLARQENGFIRPSPSGSTLGGVARTSRETILLCEAAGYNIILVETVGVGQNEITVRSMVDFFLLVMIAGAGDELQGIKRGIVEIADALLINKADGENLTGALKAKNDYGLALKYLAPATPGWETRAHICSALTGEGIKEIWALMTDFEIKTRNSGIFDDRRKKQSLDWVFGMVDHFLRDHFFNHPAIRETLPAIKQKILEGTILPTVAAEQLLNLFFSETP